MWPALYWLYGGEVVVPDLSQLQSRAEAGDIEALFALGNAYHMGLSGAAQDPARAEDCYEKAAAQGHAGAQFNLGLFCLQGRPKAGGAKDAAGALRWLELAAAQGDGGALFVLGDLYAGGSVVAADAARAFSYYLKGAEKGDARAQRAAASCYAVGQGTAVDEVQALRWLTAAAAQGDAEAMYNLAVFHSTGRGTPRDEAKAGELLRRSAEGGFAQAQYQLAQNARREDPAAALRLYEAAARQRHADAQFSLGLMLSEGQGMEQPRPQDAARWYIEAVKAGHAGAAHNLAIMQIQGRGVPADGSSAKELLEYAISRGNDDAFFSLGLLHLRGAPGCAPDAGQACLWAHLAARYRPGEQSQKLLGAAAQAAGPQAAAAAQANAAAWTRQPKTLLFHTQG